MTPHDFVQKWRGVELKERSASQSHFNDLCALLGVLDPVTADPQGEWFTFEKGASKTTGGEGWADVWRKGCFGWEYKGRHANLDKANAQLLQYSVALENPPLLIVSDMDRIVVRTNWTNTVQEVHDFTLDDLLDGARRERLKQAFTDVEAFKPQKTRQALTEETAREFASLAQRLRERGHEAHQVAHFVNRLVFCMFAEDVGLLPDHLFTKMLEVSRRDPKGFEENARTLFGAMAVKGGKVGFTAIDWFNGGLFEDDHVLPVSTDDIDELIKAARRDWSQIDPSILGTLFERGLDPDKRSQLGAHYTDREKIMMIVKPVIIAPLQAEWGRGAGEDHRAGRERAQGHEGEIAARARPGEAHARAGGGGGDPRGIHRPAGEVPRARPGLRIGQFPLCRAAGAEGHRASRQPRRRGPRPASRLSARRPGMRAGNRAQSLCRRAGAGVGMDGRDPVDAEERLRRREEPDPAPTGDDRVPGRGAAFSRHPGLEPGPA
jgi:hypothetical protein